MADDEVLTEGEIDALMESVSDGAAAVDASDDGEYRRFDFSARPQSALGQFVALGALAERQADLLAREIENVFSVEFAVRSEPPALHSVADTLAAMEPAMAVTFTALSPLAVEVFVVTAAPLASFIVNRYFGGGRTNSPVASARTSLTPTELRVAERVAGVVLETLIESWREKLALEIAELRSAAVTDRIEALPTTDLLLQLGFRLSCDDVEGRVALLVPFAALEPYQARFAPPKKQEDARQDDASWEPFFRRELPRLEVELVARLASRSIALAELLQLQRGSVVALPEPSEVAMQVEGVTLAEGRYGTFEGRKAVQLQRLGKLAQG